jgi:hypothetical protein
MEEIANKNLSFPVAQKDTSAEDAPRKRRSKRKRTLVWKVPGCPPRQLFNALDGAKYVIVRVCGSSPRMKCLVFKVQEKVRKPT